MNVWAIVPVKPLNRSRSRLAAVLPAETREQLAAEMLRNTISVLANSAAISGVLAISRDSRALVIARRFGARTVQESGAPALNQSLERANQMIASWGAQAALILPADLPLLVEDDLREITELGKYHFSVVIVPDRLEKGTNALLMRPPDLFRCRFGGSSFNEHIEVARDAGATVHVHRSERLMLDLDLPEDLMIYLELCQKYGVQPLADVNLEVLSGHLAAHKEES